MRQWMSCKAEVPIYREDNPGVDMNGQHHPLLHLQWSLEQSAINGEDKNGITMDGLLTLSTPISTPPRLEARGIERQRMSGTAEVPIHRVDKDGVDMHGQHHPLLNLQWRLEKVMAIHGLTGLSSLI